MTGSLVLQSLEFDLIVYAPYRSVEGFVNDMEVCVIDLLIDLYACESDFALCINILFCPDLNSSTTNNVLLGFFSLLNIDHWH